MGPQTSLSIVITTVGRPAGFARVVAELVDQVVQLGHLDTTRLVVVYDGCDPYRYPGSTRVPIDMDVLVHPVRQGIAQARNTGLAICESDLVAFIDDDAVPAPQWLASLYRGAFRYPDRMCFGGRVTRTAGDNRLLPRLRDEIYYLETFGPWYRLDDGHDDTDLLGPPYVNGGNCAYRRGVFDRFGSFHNGLPAYVDVEFGRRVGCQDNGVLLNGFAIHHQHPDQLSGFLRRCFTAGQARARLRRTYPEHRWLPVARSITRNLISTNLARSRRLPDMRCRALAVLTLQEVTHAVGYLAG
jgi:GT2 family glycosyltransferase